MKWPLPTALLATMLLVGGLWWRDRSEPEPVAPSPARSAARIALPPAPGLPGPSQHLPAPPQTAQVNVFPSQSWEPPPPPIPVVVEPAPLPPHLRPSPPSPFRVVSLWWDQNDFYVVLGANGEEFPLCAKCHNVNFQTVGAVLMGNYRIESIRPDGIDIVYLPNGKEEHFSLPGVALAGEPQ
jgi:hypothetical protein